MHCSFCTCIGHSRKSCTALKRFPLAKKMFEGDELSWNIKVKYHSIPAALNEPTPSTYGERILKCCWRRNLKEKQVDLTFIATWENGTVHVVWTAVNC